MRDVKRLLGVVAVAFLVCTSLGTPPVAAQETAVTLRLLEQSPVVLGFHRGTLDLRLLAFNGGSTTLKNPRVIVSFGPRITTQEGYEQGILSTEAASAVTATAIASDEKDLHFDIEPGNPQEIDMRVDIGSMSGLDQADAQVYPTVIQLWSELTAVASLVTPTIYLPKQLPVSPIRSTTWVQLSAPIAFGADGALIDGGFPSAIAEGGVLRAPLDAVAAATGGRAPDGVFDLIVDPLLITQARDLSQGYRLSDGTTVAADDQSAAEASKFLRVLSRATANPRTVETIAQPYGDPIVPAMLASGLGTQLAQEREAGSIVIDSLDTSTPGATRATSAVVRPRDGRLTDESLDWLANADATNAGPTIVLGNDDTVDRSPFQGIYAPSPIVPTTSGATLVLPDPATQALFGRSDLFTDPERGAQVILGELAVIWKQAPVPTKPTKRGIAIAPPPTLAPDVWSPLLSRLSDAPFLKPVTASILAHKVDVEGLGYANRVTPLSAPDTSVFDPAYTTQITDLTRSIEAYGSMLPDGNQTPTDLRRRLFTATAPQYQFDPTAGQPWLDSVSAATAGAFAAAEPTGSSQFTFTSSEGTIPIQFGDPGPSPLTITVELQSPSFTFPSGNSKSLTLEQPGGQVIEFDAIAQGSGESTINVLVHAPDGQTISTTRVTVRSTAVNRIALLVTAGAGLGLVLLYARRWSRRRRNATS
jgi:hypothetical protein